MRETTPARKGGRGYELLDEFGTHPKVVYLKKYDKAAGEAH